MNVDFGSASLGTSVTKSATLPLSIAITDLPSGTVIYAGGSSDLDVLLVSFGIVLPLTAGQLARRFPALMLTYQIAGVTVSGADAVDFAVSPGNCVGNTGASCNASADFRPTLLGARQATVTPVIHNVVLAGGGFPGVLATALASLFESYISAQLAFGVAGAGTVPATIAPASIAFGTIEKGNTATPVKVTVTSATTVPIKLLAARIGGVNILDFVITTDGLSGQTLAPGASLNATVAARPARRGAVNAVFQVTHDAPLSPLVVPLAATGIAPVVTSSTHSLDFGGIPIGMSSPERLVEVVNAGDAPLRVTSFSLSGAGAANFAVGDNNCLGAAIAPGAKAYLTLSFTPLAPGTQDAIVALVDNEVSPPFSIALRGNGVSSADLAVYLAADRWHVNAGGTLVYIVTARNGGPSSAIGTSVSLRLPRNATFVSADKPCISPPIGTTGTIIRKIGTLHVGVVDVLTITTQVTTVPASRMRAIAKIASATPVAFPDNDSAAIDTTTNA
jgi:uncharacterized repeat protein (TIGR01451 family)